MGACTEVGNAGKVAPGAVLCGQAYSAPGLGAAAAAAATVIAPTPPPPHQRRRQARTNEGVGCGAVGDAVVLGPERIYHVRGAEVDAWEAQFLCKQTGVWVWQGGSAGVVPQGLRPATTQGQPAVLPPKAAAGSLSCCAEALCSQAGARTPTCQQEATHKCVVADEHVGRSCPQPRHRPLVPEQQAALVFVVC